MPADFAAQTARALAGARDPGEDAVEIVDGHMVAGDADELESVAQEPADQGDAGLQVVRLVQGLLVLARGAAEAVDDLLDLEQADLPLLHGHHEEIEFVLAGPLLDEGGQLAVGQGQGGDPEGLFEDLFQRGHAVLGQGLVLVAVGVGIAAEELGREVVKKALHPRHALPVEVVHQAAQDALVEQGVRLAQEV